MTTPHYYVYPFGQNADDLTSIPDTAAIDGSMSYYAGFTPPYEYNLVTNPSALPIPRGQFNQLMFDITNNIQEYQQYGTPQWVTGNTVLYPIYARVYYGGLVYENEVADNTATPGVDATWRVVSGNTEGVQAGTIIDYVGVNPPSGYLNCDGSAVSRTTYAGLLSAITQTQTGTTTNTVNTLTGLSDTSQMFVGMHIEGVGIQAGTTIATISSSTAITMSQVATASASVPVQFFNWGAGDGTTTFNVPDFRRKSTIGSGGSSTAIVGSVVGQSGGTENKMIGLNETPNHTHDPLTAGDGFDMKLATPSAGGDNYVAGTQNKPSATTGGMSGHGAQTALSLYHPIAVVKKCIKT